MRLDSLNKYQHIYQSSLRMDVYRIFQKFFGLKSCTPVPFSISHGVDFGHCFEPMDYKSIEPIHWAYNSVIINGIRGLKPFVKLPHPWLMIDSYKPSSPGRGVLIIGPPPGRSNDYDLFIRLGPFLNRNPTILVKCRGDVAQSMNFWRQNGIEPVTLDRSANSFYEKLFDLISGYDTVVTCTLSSAAIFAASIGKNIEFIKDYEYGFYDKSDHTKKIVNFESTYARRFVHDFVTSDNKTRKNLARDILGYSFFTKKKRMLDEVHKVVDNLKYPTYCTSSGTRSRLSSEIARITGRPGLVNFSFSTLLKRLHLCDTASMSAYRIKELDVWLNGQNESNFGLGPIRNRNDKVIRGYSVNQY